MSRHYNVLERPSSAEWDTHRCAASQIPPPAVSGPLRGLLHDFGDPICGVVWSLLLPITASFNPSPNFSQITMEALLSQLAGIHTGD